MNDAGTCSNFYPCLPANLSHVMNTKVDPKIIIYLLVKFQTHQTCVARDIAKILQLGFWKN